MLTKKIGPLLGSTMLVASMLGSCAGGADIGTSVSSGTTASSASTQASTTDDAKPKQEPTYWRLTKKTSHSNNSPYDYWSASDVLYSYEFDNNGNLHKLTMISVNHKGDDHPQEYRDVSDTTSLGEDNEVSERIIEYTYDESGYPLTKSERYSLSTEEWIDGKETYSDPEVTEFTFERDKEGRLVKAKGPGLPYEDDTEMQFTYYDSGELKSITSTEEHLDYDSWDFDKKVRVDTIEEYRKDGSTQRSTSKTFDESGKLIKQTETNYNEKGYEETTETKRPQKDGDDLVTKTEYKNTYKDDKLVKCEEWIYGDGVTETREYIGSDLYGVVHMPDASFTASKLLLKLDDEGNSSYVHGEMKTYDAQPHNTREITRSADGVAQQSVSKYFDGDEYRISYDKFGLEISEVSLSFGGERATEFQHEQIEQPNEFVRNFNKFNLAQLDPYLAQVYSEVE